MPGIIWLASYPKSGNTWVRAILANLLVGSTKPLPINELPKHFLGDNFLIHYEQFTGEKVDELSAEELRALRPKVHEWFAYSQPDNAFVKTHNAVLRVGGQPLITPSATAAAIYVVRNPLDVAVSFAHHYQVSNERAVESLCDETYVLPPSGGQLEQVLSSWSRHVRSWTQAPGLPLHVMRYEDMHLAPVKTFGALSEFLKLPEDRARLRRAIKFSSFRELSGQERRDRFVESRPDGTTAFFREGKVGSGRNVLTPAQIERLVTAHGTVMQEFGYLDDSGAMAT